MANGIQDLTSIMMQGGRGDVPMRPAAGGIGGMMPPPQGGMPPPQGGMPPPPQGGMPPPPQGGMPPTMAEQMPMQEEMPMEEPVSIEQDAAALAEAVIGRAGGDPQAAVAILDTAAQMIMQTSQEEPMMAAGGAYMKKPKYAFAGEYLGDESELLRQMIMDNMQTGRTLSDAEMEILRGEMEETPREKKFWKAYQANPDAFSKDALEAEAVEKARLKALERAKAYRSR